MKVTLVILEIIDKMSRRLQGFVGESEKKKKSVIERVESEGVKIQP